MVAAISVSDILLTSPSSARNYNESILALQQSAIQLATRPHASSGYALRLYPLSLERSSLLAQHAAEEDYAHETVRIAYEEERDRVEEEWKKGRAKVRDRMLEGIEERRRRAREEKDGEGISGMSLSNRYMALFLLCTLLQTRHSTPSRDLTSPASCAIN